MKKTALRILAFIMVMTATVSFMVACRDDDGATPPAAPEADPNLYDLTGFKIIREDNGGQGIANATADLKRAISDIIGLDLSVATDTEATGEKEIIIGQTERPESVSTVAYLKKQNKNEESFAIRIAKNKIVITGTDELSTRRAVYEFINNYVKKSSAGTSLNIAAGNQQIAVYDEDNIIVTANGTVIHVDQAGQMFGYNDTKYTSADGCVFVPQSASYPSITELRYQKNPADNGKLIATMNMNASELTPPPSATGGCVMMSEDKGKTWKALARPTESLCPTLGSVGSMAHIYELPAQVGDMPAGTLLYSYNAVNYDQPTGLNGRSILAVWRSFDCGVHWEEYVIIDEAKGIKEGIWEPFMIYSEEDGYLYCFYSDDSDPDHDQKVVYKRSKDGVHWEGEGGKIGTGTGKDVEPVDVVAINKFAYRPGMPVITKMGNGEYFMVYEQFGDGNKDWDGDCRIFYKTTKNLADWGDPSDMGEMIPEVEKKKTAGSPSCVWLDVGGECGILLVASKRSSNAGVIFVSLDYGKTWQTIDNPLKGTKIKGEGDRVGYSPAFWLSIDGKTLYYMSSINDKKDPATTQVMGFARMTIYGPMKY